MHPRTFVGVFFYLRSWSFPKILEAVSTNDKSGFFRFYQQSKKSIWFLHTQKTGYVNITTQEPRGAKFTPFNRPYELLKHGRQTAKVAFSHKSIKTIPYEVSNLKKMQPFTHPCQWQKCNLLHTYKM